MAEAIIARSGSSSDDGSGVKWQWKLKTEVITENKNWVMPSQVKNDEVSVFIYGGGGGTENEMTMDSDNVWVCCGGGGGGWMNNGIFTIASGSSVQINIGSRGVGSSGGTTRFGAYLSANGGGKADGGYGGNGGSGGGAGARSLYQGGTGYQFGGGGGGAGDWNGARGGNGGKFGGAGGHCVSTWNNCKRLEQSFYNNNYANPDYIQNGLGLSANLNLTGNTGKNNINGFVSNATNGVNRYGLDSEENIFYNATIQCNTGTAGNSAYKINNYMAYLASGGGGGYGGDGGDGAGYLTSGYGESLAGGGGGGYYSKGGNGNINYNWGGGGGGGGGYCHNGHDGVAYRNYAFYGGGGGGYGPSGYGRGATGTNFWNYQSGGQCPHEYAMPGICILQYYQLTAT